MNNLALKYRNRMDRLAPHLAFRQLSKVAKAKMPGLVRRLYELAEDPDPKIALHAMEMIFKYSGVQSYVETGIKKAAEGPEDDEDEGEEEESRGKRRKSLVKRYVVPAPAEG